MNKFKYFLLVFLGILIISSCYKEDNSELYSRQLVLSMRFKDLNNRIDTLNNTVKTYKSLYEAVKNNTLIQSIDYLPNKENPNAVKVVFGDGKSITIPYGKNGKDGVDGKNGKDGKDGKTPVITISPDGFWVIDGEKTTHAVQGETPVVRAVQDSENPSDKNYYWTIQYGDKPAEFILYNGNKIRANGLDGKNGKDGKDGKDGKNGKDGERGEVGPQGPQGPVGTQPIQNIIANGGNVTFKTSFGDFTFDMSPLTFILKPQSLKTFDADKSTLVYDSPEETFEVPIEISDDVVNIGASLPSGWTYKADIPNKKLIVTAPSYDKLNISMYEGTASFIAFDQKMKSVVQYINLKLNTYMYLDYFFNPLETIADFRSDNTTYNIINFATPDCKGVKLYGFLLDSKTQKMVKIYNIDVAAEGGMPNMLNYPNFKFPKLEGLDNKNITFASIFYNENTDVNLAVPTTNENNIEAYGLIMNDYTKDPEYNTAASLPAVENTPDNKFIANADYNTYMGMTNTMYTQGSDIIYTRLHRAANFIRIIVKDPKTMLGLPDGFDIKKLNLFQSYIAKYEPVNDNSAMPGYNCVDSRSMTYDKDKDILTIEYYFLHATRSATKIYIYYDGQPLSALVCEYSNKPMFRKHINQIFYINVPSAYDNVNHIKINPSSNERCSANSSCQFSFDEKGYSAFSTFGVYKYTKADLPQLN